MNELVKKLMDEANLDEQLANKVVSVVSDFAKQKLPEPFGSQVTAFLQGQDMSQMMGMLEGFLGGFKK